MAKGFSGIDFENLKNGFIKMKRGNNANDEEIIHTAKENNLEDDDSDEDLIKAIALSLESSQTATMVPIDLD